MMNFRDKQPIRTCVKKYANYKSYKPYLAKDFFNRCGYTDCSDFWFGGMNNFHIDHFKPWKKYPQNPLLKTDYQNLVYCCSYVNILKSDDQEHTLILAMKIIIPISKEIILEQSFLLLR